MKCMGESRVGAAYITKWIDNTLLVFPLRAVPKWAVLNSKKAQGSKMFQAAHTPYLFHWWDTYEASLQVGAYFTCLSIMAQQEHAFVSHLLHSTIKAKYTTEGMVLIDEFTLHTAVHMTVWEAPHHSLLLKIKYTIWYWNLATTKLGNTAQEG